MASGGAAGRRRRDRGGDDRGSAQVFGTFSWQMQPFCNVVTLTLTSVTGNFTLDGSDDQCGATKKGERQRHRRLQPRRDGRAELHHRGVAERQRRCTSQRSVSPANGQGTWTDNAGNSGTFAFFGSDRRPAAAAAGRCASA